MKDHKLVLILLIGLLAGLLVGCNKDIIDTNYTYDRAIVMIGSEAQELSIKQWRDYEDGEQIQLITTDGKVYLVNSVNCTLIND